MIKYKKLEMEELNRLSVDEFSIAPKSDFSFILDDVRSLQNVGSIFRTGDAFRVDTIYLCGITGRPPHRDIHKTALGATENVTWLYEENAQSLVNDLKQIGWKIIGIEQTQNSIDLDNFVFESESKYAFILGNEVNGVSQSLLELCDAVIEIPQLGTKHSLNISVSAGIVAWQFYSKTIGKTL
jgi:tRNA G18 (ribose-2'-O)-methylase SpoU